MKRLRSFLQHSFIRGGILLTISNLLVGLFNYVFNSYTAKRLGPTGYSEVTALFAYFSILSIPILVISTEIVRRLGQSEKTRLLRVKKWETWIFHNIKKWWFLLVPYFLLGFFLSSFGNLQLSSAFTLLALLLFSVMGIFYLASFQGLHLFTIYSGLAFSAVLLKVFGPFVFLPQLSSIDTIYFFLIISGALPILLSMFILRRKYKDARIKENSEISQKGIRQVLVDSSLLITVLSLLGITFMNNLDVIFVKKFLSVQEAGIYGAWNLLSKIIFYGSGSAIGLTLIFFSSIEYKKHHIRVLTSSVVGLLIIGAGFYTLYSVFGPSIVSYMFSHRYNALVPILPSAALFGTFYTFVYFINNFFLARNSRLSLIVLGIVPLYALSLYFFGQSIERIIQIDIATAFIVGALYIGALLHYNSDHGRRAKKALS